MNYLRICYLYLVSSFIQLYLTNCLMIQLNLINYKNYELFQNHS